MKRSRSLLAIGVTVAALACAGCAHARKRTPQRRSPSPSRVVDRRAPLRVVMILLAVASPHAWSFDAGEAFGGIWGFLGGVASGVRDFVQEAIEKAMKVAYDVINFVDNTYDDITRAIGATVDWLATNAVNAADAVAHVVDRTYELLDMAFSNFRDQAKAMLEHAYDDVKNFVLGQIPDLLDHLLGDAWTFLGALATLGRNGLDFLIALIEDPLGTIWSLIKQSVEDTVGAVAPPIEWIFEKVWDLGLARAKAEIDATLDLVDTVRTIWPYVEWFVTHPPNKWKNFASDEIPKAIKDFAGLAATLVREQETEPENFVRALLGLPKKPAHGLIGGSIVGG